MLKPSVVVAAIVALSLSLVGAMHTYLHSAPDGAPFDHVATCPKCGEQAHMHCNDKGYWSGSWTCTPCQLTFIESP